MTTEEMRILTNRFKEVLAVKDPEIKQARLEILLLDIEDAYVNDSFAAMMYQTVAEKIWRS